jgi:hypothetical protein
MGNVAVNTTDSQPEALLFVALGQSPFRDYVLTIQPDGKGLTHVLNPTPNRSYFSFSANSLHGTRMVVVHEGDGSGLVTDQLYTNTPANNEWTRLVDNNRLHEGPGIISPDEHIAVFSLAEQKFPMRYQLWMKNPLFAGIKAA